MDKHTTGDKSELLGQLGHLERQVSALSSELQARSETIEILERSLNEKRLHISELEMALRVAQQSMLDMAWDNVQHYQQQLWSGISRQLTGPKFAELRQLLELIRSFPERTSHYVDIRIIKPGNHFVQVAVKNIDMMTGDSASYYQNTLNAIVSKYHMGKKQLNEFFVRFIEEAQNFIDQKVVWPIKNGYEDMSETLKEMPSEARLFFQDKIFRQAGQYAGGLSVQYSRVQIEAQGLIANVRRAMQPVLSHWYNIIAGKIKSLIDSQGGGSSGASMAGTYA